VLALDRPAATDAAERYLHLPRPLFTRLPVSYRLVPLSIRTRILRLLARIRSAEPRFPAWPIEPSIDIGVSGGGYAGRRAALVITHDVDSRPELDLIEGLRSLERRLGVVSSWGFVPDQSWPTEDQARRLVDEGCDVYWHDIGHDGRLPYLPIDDIRAAFDRVASQSPWAPTLMRAFRSGQLLASTALMDVVAERFAVDLSIPDTERDGPYGSTAGCGTVFPFRFRGVLELPLTLPQDVFLREVYGLSAEETLAAWTDKLAHVKLVGGVAVLNVHPIWANASRPDMLGAFERFVRAAAADDDLLITTPGRLSELLTPVAG
jgi:hypothetical protein